MIRSEVYQIPRMTLAFLALREYAAQFWWFLAVIPLFGLMATVWGSGALRIVGLMGLLWPLTLPGRSYMATSRASRLFVPGATFEFDGEEVRFLGVPTREGKVPRVRLSRQQVRRVYRRGPWLLVQERRFGVLPVALSSLQPKDVDDLVSRAWGPGS